MKTVEFGSLFQFIRNGMNVKQDKSGDGIPITRIETIANATIDAARVGFAGLAEEDCRGWLMEPGDILFSHINSVDHVGKCAVYRGAPKKLIHGMNLLCLRCDETQLIPEFAKYLIREKEFRGRLLNFINKAVNQASVSIGNLKTIPVIVPPLTEQRRIAAILDQPGSRYFCESFYGHPCPTSGKSYATAYACGGPSRPASFVEYPTRGIQHHSRNDSTRFRKACIFTTQKDAS